VRIAVTGERNSQRRPTRLCVIHYCRSIAVRYCHLYTPTSKIVLSPHYKRRHVVVIWNCIFFGRTVISTSSFASWRARADRPRTFDVTTQQMIDIPSTHRTFLRRSSTLSLSRALSLPSPRLALQSS